MPCQTETLKSWIWWVVLVAKFYARSEDVDFASKDRKIWKLPLQGDPNGALWAHCMSRNAGINAVSAKNHVFSQLSLKAVFHVDWDGEWLQKLRQWKRTKKVKIKMEKTRPLGAQINAPSHLLLLWSFQCAPFFWVLQANRGFEKCVDYASAPPHDQTYPNAYSSINMLAPPKQQSYPPAPQPLHHPPTITTPTMTILLARNQHGAWKQKALQHESDKYSTTWTSETPRPGVQHKSVHSQNECETSKN